MQPLEDSKDRTLKEYLHDEYFVNVSAVIVVTTATRIIEALSTFEFYSRCFPL